MCGRVLIETLASSSCRQLPEGTGVCRGADHSSVMVVGASGAGGGGGARARVCVCVCARVCVQRRLTVDVFDARCGRAGGSQFCSGVVACVCVCGQCHWVSGGDRLCLSLAPDEFPGFHVLSVSACGRVSGTAKALLEWQAPHTCTLKPLSPGSGTYITH